MNIMSWMIPMAAVITLALLVMLAIARHNARHFPHLAPLPTGPHQSLPPLSVLIPARNEAAHIGRMVAALVAQDYPNFEILILDDHSTDDTAQEALTAAAGNPHVQVLPGTPLPAGWVGKNWACHQLAAAARHDWLLFTDADVIWQPGALRAVIHHSLGQGADLLTVWPTQLTVTWAERLVVPLMSFFLLGYLPIGLAHDPRAIAAAAANGQCLLFTRAAYQRSGGHAAIHASLVDDISLAYRIKQAGLRLRMANGSSLVQCRMYETPTAVINGYTKTLVAAHGNSTPRLLLATFAQLGLFVAPWLLAPIAAGYGAWMLCLWWFALGLLGISIRMQTAATAGLRRRDALLLPLSILIYTYIALHAIWVQLRHGGPIWKGRRVTSP